MPKRTLYTLCMLLIFSIFSAHAQIKLIFNNLYTKQPLHVVLVIGMENNGKIEIACDDDDNPKLMHFILPQAELKGRVGQMLVRKTYTLEDESDCITQIFFFNTDDENPKLLHAIKLLSDPLQKGIVEIRDMYKTQIRILRYP